jgi:hypothetical protein
MLEVTKVFYPKGKKAAANVRDRSKHSSAEAVELPLNRVTHVLIHPNLKIIQVYSYKN